MAVKQVLLGLLAPDPLPEGCRGNHFPCRAWAAPKTEGAYGPRALCVFIDRSLDYPVWTFLPLHQGMDVLNRFG